MLLFLIFNVILYDKSIKKKSHFLLELLYCSTQPELMTHHPIPPNSHALLPFDHLPLYLKRSLSDITTLIHLEC